MDDEQRYTLAEADEEFRRRACAVRGHTPDNYIRTLESIVPVDAFCECGEYHWQPVRSTTHTLAD